MQQISVYLVTLAFTRKSASLLCRPLAALILRLICTFLTAWWATLSAQLAEDPDHPLLWKKEPSSGLPYLNQWSYQFSRLSTEEIRHQLCHLILLLQNLPHPSLHTHVFHLIFLYFYSHLGNFTACLLFLPHVPSHTGTHPTNSSLYILVPLHQNPALKASAFSQIVRWLRWGWRISTSPPPAPLAPRFLGGIS